MQTATNGGRPEDRAAVLGADRTPRTTLGRSRARVLSELESGDGALTVADIAERVGLHQNTARFHLDALVETGHAERHVEERHQPGRPRTLYSATPDSAAVGQRSYRMLAEILAGHVAAHSHNPAETAARAGREWGRFVADRPAPFERVDTAAATTQLVDVLDRIGFRPRAVTAAGDRLIELHHCPFRELAVTQAKVVCSIHLGLMQGVLDEIDAPIEAERVEPFVEPSVCLIHLAPRRQTRR